MNEQIEKLVRQAEAAYIPRYDMWQMDSETLQKFAELFIRECIMLLYEDDGATHHEELILNYFGVQNEHK
jgi:hypothetical protein